MEVLLSLSIALFAGLMMTRVCKPFGLPAVTGYLVAGILVGPYCLGQLGVGGLGFTSYENVEEFKILSEAALGFIAFTIGNEFRLSTLKQIGKKAVIIAIFGAVGATILVDGALIGLS
ncbi:MAG: cation:proton antiporter, partial [Ruminococcus sp.]|nr:cation:proton antiporter [Ruminococcus sp.]